MPHLQGSYDNAPYRSEFHALNFVESGTVFGFVQQIVVLHLTVRLEHSLLEQRVSWLKIVLAHVDDVDGHLQSIVPYVLHKHVLLFQRIVFVQARPFPTIFEYWFQV
ncbi:hypothetical protein D3C72_2010560 [compost metagenome]